MFLMSFYLRGMSFIDMAFLKKSDLKSNRPKKAGLIFIFGPVNILLFRKVVWQKAF